MVALVIHLQNILRLLVKELRSLRADPIMLVLIAYSFSFQVYVAATAMPEGLSKVPIAVVDEDGSLLRVIDNADAGETP